MKKNLIGILICMLLMVATILPVAGNVNKTIYEDNDISITKDFLSPSGKKPISIEHLGNFEIYPSDMHGSRGVPEYEFIAEPTTIMTSYYDYMPGSYTSHPIRLQTENGDGHYLTFLARPNAQDNRRQYWAYVDENSNILDWGAITSYDEWQGYGSIGIHPATGDCIVGWHEDVDADPSVDHTTITFDDFDASEVPGLWEDPLIVPPTGEMEYAWPYMYVGPSPIDGYVRIYQLANNAKGVPNPSPPPPEIPCEDVRIMWIDVENINGADLSVLLDINNWDYVTVFTDWRDKFVRPFQAFAIDYSTPGRVAFIGDATWVEGDLGDMPVDEGAFVWESFDYGETWDYANLHADGPTDYLYLVANPGFPDAPDELEVRIWGRHSTALFDSDGNLHWPYLQLYGWIEGEYIYYYPYLMPQAEIVWDGSNFTSQEVPELPGIDPLSGHSVPWDDTYIYPTITWSTYPSGDSPIFHENMQKQAINRENNWMAQMWVDGTYAQLGADGEPGFEEYIEHPLIFISISIDNGNTWFDPIELTDIFSEKFDFSEQTTVYPYLCDQIIDRGDNWGQIDMYYFDDNEFGSRVHGTGWDSSGNITYCSIEIQFVEPGADSEIRIGEISGGLGVSAVIENTGEITANNIDWTITVTGGILGLINKTKTGIIPALPVDENVTIKSGFLLGLGSIAITVEATPEGGDKVIKEADGKIFLFWTTVNNTAII